MVMETLLTMKVKNTEFELRSEKEKEYSFFFFFFCYPTFLFRTATYIIFREDEPLDLL